MSLDLEAARNGNGNGHANGNGKVPEPLLDDSEREYRYSSDEE
jgi:hypothetical protein